MKSVLLLFIFIISSYTFSFAQTFSSIIDSIAKKHISQLPVSKQKPYTDLLLLRHQNGLNARIDSTVCDYVYIEERYNYADSSNSVMEYYFNAKPGSIYINNATDQSMLPNLLFHNGQLIDQRYEYYGKTLTGGVFDNMYETYYTLDTLLWRCNQLKPIQEFSYDATPAVVIPANPSDDRVKDLSTVRLQKGEQIWLNVYQHNSQIVTLIDHQKNTVMVSVQTPAKNPKIKAHLVKFETQQW